MNVLDQLVAAEKEATLPLDGTDEAGWQAYNNAVYELERLLRNHAADLLAVVRAAQEYVDAVTGPSGTIFAHPSSVPLRDALSPLLTTEGSDE